MALILVYPQGVLIVYQDNGEVEEISLEILFDQWGEPETQPPDEINDEDR